MTVSVETLSNLERKVSISVPADKVEKEVSQRLMDLARKVKVDGFRPGKVPMNVVKSRFTSHVLEEVARDLVQTTLFEALKENDLVPAGMPQVEPEQLETGKDFKYTAHFEIFPTFEVNELNKAEVEVVKSSVSAKDVDEMLDKLLEQNKEWHEVDKKAAKDHKVVIDFEGSIDGTLFEGGSAEGYELHLGSGSMIPGFEEGIIGKKAGKPFDISVTFPDDYGHQPLAGKEANFKITLHKVMEGKKPELDDAFAEKFNIKEGGIEALKKDIKENMERELERRVSMMNKERLFDKLREVNSFDLPKALVDQEIDNMKHEMYHRIFGHQHKEDEVIPDFPRELFEEQAKKRVQLGLLISEYVKKHQLAASAERVDAMIEKMAAAYEDPEELRQWYKGNKEHLAEVEALVLEEMVAETIGKDAKLKDKKMSYDAVMNPKTDEDKKGAK